MRWLAVVLPNGESADQLVLLANNCSSSQGSTVKLAGGGQRQFVHKFERTRREARPQPRSAPVEEVTCRDLGLTRQLD